MVRKYRNRGDHSYQAPLNADRQLFFHYFFKHTFLMKNAEAVFKISLFMKTRSAFWPEKLKNSPFPRFLGQAWFKKKIDTTVLSVSDHIMKAEK